MSVNNIRIKLVAMSEIISQNIEKLKEEKMEVHESLVRLKELEIQKWTAKAETMLEVLNLIEDDLT